MFEPAEAKPGQTVTLKIKVELADGYYTYPVVSRPPEGKYSANKITFPTDGPVVFVGETVDPVGPKSKKVEDYEISPTTPGAERGSARPSCSRPPRPGRHTAKVKVKLLVCDDDHCFPPKTIELEATLKVLDGPAVEVGPEVQGRGREGGEEVTTHCNIRLSYATSRSSVVRASAL